VQRWLSVAAGELVNGPGALRLTAVFKAPIDRERAERTSQRLLKLLEGSLAKRPFLAASTLTLADLALYTYTAHAPEGGVSLEAFPNVRGWLARIEALPGFVAMQRSPS
jgi:glutathione S-transferase